ncbi:MAG: LacI family DNA-binding transcriptional regulator [Lautropia sp.]
MARYVPSIAPSGTRTPTLRDVAQAAGVSISTAGRVLRDADYPIGPALRARVMEAAERLGYVPNALARTLRAGASATVGLIVGDMQDPYFGEIAEAITQHAESAHSTLAIVCNMQRDPLLELKYCQRLWENRVGGLILAGGGFDQWSHLGQLSALLRQMDRAGVAIATLSPRQLALAQTFCADNELAGAMMARHLVENGHRRVGVMLGPPQGEVTQQRLRGVTRVLTGAGARFHVIHSLYTPQAGADGVRTLLEGDPELTGFIVGSSTMALGVCERLGQLGRSVPDAASVISIGNGFTAKWSVPRLTTVDVRLADWGRLALDYVVTRAAGGSPAGAADLPPRLVVGQSVASLSA